MPPKGWRKNGDSVQMPKEAELVSIDDILFPRSTIQKLARSILTAADPSALTPAATADNMSLTKDSLIAVQRSATVFVSHLMFHARQLAKDSGRKNVSSQDILHTLERVDLAGFAPEIRQKLSVFETDAKTKKKLKADARESGAVDSEPPAKKLKENSAKTVLKTGKEQEDEGDDEDDETSKNDDPTVLPPNAETENEEDEDEGEEAETVAVNPIALLGQEEEELGGLEPEEPQQEGDKDTEEEEEEE